MKKLLYQKIADNLKHKIQNKVLNTGDKLPSLRTICKENGISLNTAQQAYLELESAGLIESRPKSGYYVSAFVSVNLPEPKTTQPEPESYKSKNLDEIVNKVFQEVGNKGKSLFSVSVPQTKLLPVARLNKSIINAIHELEACGTQYEPIQGNKELRRQIARTSYTWDGRLNESDIISTNGCLNSIAYCLMATLKTGDTLAVESPVYFGILQLAEALGLRVLELPTHPITGIEVDALKKAVKKNKVNACLLISNFSNPMGSCMPDENKRAVVKLLEKYNIPLIEDDIYGDIYFGVKRPEPCKAYDESGNVLWCSSVSKTLAPGYRVGWVAPGKYFNQVLKLKSITNISSPSLTSQAIATFLKNGRYENHLRNLRKTLHSNSLQFIRTITESFPEDTNLTAPRGGFIVWVILNKKIDTINLFNQTLQQKISFAPGRLFTLQNQYNNCLRLSFGAEWTKETEKAIKQIGNTCKSLL